MEETPDISGAELVISHFGHWPEFLDNEIVCISLDRGGPTLDFVVHAFDYEPGEPQGAPRLVKSCFVHFRCTGVEGVTLNHFNSQNAVEGICFENLRQPFWENDLWKITIDGVHGVTGEVRAREIEVVSLVPTEEPPVCIAH